MTQTIEQLTARVAELESIIEGYAPYHSINAQLAAEQAAHAAAVLSNVQLRDEISLIAKTANSAPIREMAKEVLATPISTEALDKYVAEKVKEYQKHNGILGREVKDLTRQRDLAVEALRSINKITGDAGFNIGGPLEHCHGDIDSDELQRMLSLACEYLKDTSKAAFRALSTIKESEGK